MSDLQQTWTVSARGQQATHDHANTHLPSMLRLTGELTGELEVPRQRNEQYCYKRKESLKIRKTHHDRHWRPIHTA